MAGLRRKGLVQARGAVLKLPQRDRLLHFGLRPLIARGVLRADLTVADPDMLQFGRRSVP
ncbi:MAG: hypothetical protein U5N55_01425 [Cypionkella sp.]|nr:hypothetical protein [Cypionkella sp.]